LLTHSGGLLEQTERNEEFSRLLTGMETMQALLAQSQPPLEPSDEPTDDSPAHAPVESATVSTETGDNSLENQTRLADDLIAASRFDDAVALVEGLLKKFPDHDSTRTLLSRVRHEAQTYHDEQCNRYYELIQEHAQNRNWVSAVQAAHRLIHDFPDSKESAEAQTMMPTLVDNARLQEVRDYREAIRDLLAHGKFADLVSLGETILENYPETALADELRTKLPLWRQQAEGA